MGDQGDLPRALRFAVSHMQPGASGPTAPMSDQDREWLKEVIGQMATPANGEKDPDGKPKCRGIADVLKSFVVLLEKGNSAHLKESVASELQHIADEAEILDRADDNERKISVESIKTLFSLATKGMIAPLCSILAELAQNSPECQLEAICLVPQLTALIEDEEHSAQTRSKAVYALSAIIRGNPSAEVNGLLFSDEERNGVVDILAKLVCKSDESVQVRTKAAFLLSCLVPDHDVRNYLFKNHEKQLVELQEENENIKELVDGILQSIQTNKLAEDKPLLALKM